MEGCELPVLPLLLPNDVTDGLNLCLGRREALSSCPFRPNQIAVDNHFEITSSAAVLDFIDQDLTVESLL